MNQNAKLAQNAVAKSKPNGVKKYQGIRAKAVQEIVGGNQRPNSDG